MPGITLRLPILETSEESSTGDEHCTPAVLREVNVEVNPETPPTEGTMNDAARQEPSFVPPSPGTNVYAPPFIPAHLSAESAVKELGTIFSRAIIPVTSGGQESTSGSTELKSKIFPSIKISGNPGPLMQGDGFDFSEIWTETPSYLSFPGTSISSGPAYDPFGEVLDGTHAHMPRRDIPDTLDGNFSGASEVDPSSPPETFTKGLDEFGHIHRFVATSSTAHKSGGPLKSTSLLHQQYESEELFIGVSYTSFTGMPTTFNLPK